MINFFLTLNKTAQKVDFWPGATTSEIKGTPRPRPVTPTPTFDPATMYGHLSSGSGSLRKKERKAISVYFLLRTEAEKIMWNDVQNFF